MLKRKLAVFATAAVAIGGTEAGAIEVGEPIAAPPAGTMQMVEGSWRLEPVRAPDPDGGPPWAIATYLATGEQIPRTVGTVVCTSVGRVVDGSLGGIDAAGVYHPFEPRVGTVACSGRNAGAESRGYGYFTQLARSRGDEERCARTVRDVQLTGLQLCDQRTIRTLFGGVLGAGVRSAELRRNGRWERLEVSADGALLAVLRGAYSDATQPSVRIRATVCGSDARKELLGSWGARRTGCTVTVMLPAEPRPAIESKASRHARGTRRLHVPLTIRERRGVASRRRYTLAFRVPITVRSSSEGYSWRIVGPGGAKCRRQRAVSAERSMTSSYLAVEGRSFTLPLPPIDGMYAAWCPGRYRVEAVFSSFRLARARGRGGPLVKRYAVKVIGMTTFVVNR